MSISVKNIGWVAGLLEGEGTFQFTGTPTISINSTDLDTIRRLRSIVGCKNEISISNPKKRPGRHNHSILYRLSFGSSLAVQWMMTIYSLMSIRRKEQIQAQLRIWIEMPGQGKKSDLINKINRVRNLSRMNSIPSFQANSLIFD